MKRSSLVVAAFLGVVALVPGLAGAETKLSGQVVAVGPDGKSFAIEELGPEGKPVRRTVALGAGARLVEVSRNAAAPSAAVSEEWPGGFRERPIDARDLRVGDFVTLSLDRAGDTVTAVANRIEVVKPDAGEFSASPRTGAPTRPDLPVRR